MPDQRGDEKQLADWWFGCRIGLVYGTVFGIAIGLLLGRL